MRWWGPLGILAAVRVAIPLAAYADEGSKLPGIPVFDRDRRLGGLVETWREAYRIEESTNEILTAVMRERQRRDPRLLDTPF